MISSNFCWNIYWTYSYHNKLYARKRPWRSTLVTIKSNGKVMESIHSQGTITIFCMLYILLAFIFLIIHWTLCYIPYSCLRFSSDIHLKCSFQFKGIQLYIHLLNIIYVKKQYISYGCFQLCTIHHWSNQQNQ